MKTKYFPTASPSQTLRQSKWVKLFMKIFWIVIAVHFAAQLFSFLLLPYPRGSHEFFYEVLFYPSIIMCAVVALAQYFQRVAAKYSFYALFLAGTIVSMVIIHLNMDIRIISSIMLLPIVASAIFFRISLTLFTAILQIIGFFVLFRWDHWFRDYLSPFDLIAIPIFLVICTMVAIIIIISGRELVNDLEETLMAKQDLLIENAIISQRSKIDALTNLYNHISFYEFYEKALEDANNGGAPFHLALIDIDNFKGINDTYGHRVGDIVLSRVAKVIKDNIDSTDIAARYGGEEFAVLLFEQTFEKAYALIDSIRAKLSMIVHDEMEGRSVTVSIGLKSYSKSVTKESLFEDVDSLLYDAKRKGKNKTVSPG